MKTFTFHVSLPGYGRVWRKLELPAEDTLESLHRAIQDAYQFDDDHLYSFFMSGKAWDPDTEFSLPEDALGDDDYFESDDESDEEAADEAGDEEPEDALPMAGVPDEMPSPAEMRELLETLQANPEIRAEVRKLLTEQAGVPGFLVDMVFDNPALAASMLGNLPAGDDDFGLFDGGTARDVRTTTLESLGLQKGKQFLYLFDYGDNWQFKVKVSAINNNADPQATYPRVVETVGDAPPQYRDWDEDGDADDADAEPADETNPF